MHHGVTFNFGSAKLCSPAIFETSFSYDKDIYYGSHVAQLVGCWTYNPRVVGSIPSDANCFMWDNILGQDVNLVCASLHPGEIWVPSFKGYWLLCLAW